MTTAETQAAGLVRGPDPRRPSVASRTVTAASGLRADVDPDLAGRFTDFAELCSRFSREIVERSGSKAVASVANHTRLNLQIARTVFGKWSINILAFLYTGRAARFQEIKKALGQISSRVLSLKLSRLERLALVRRKVLETRPPRVEYSLTEKGLRVAKLGEPVVLYLRMTEGLLVPDRH